MDFHYHSDQDAVAPADTVGPEPDVDGHPKYAGLAADSTEAPGGQPVVEVGPEAAVDDHSAAVGLDADPVAAVDGRPAAGLLEVERLGC